MLTTKWPNEVFCKDVEDHGLEIRLFEEKPTHSLLKLMHYWHRQKVQVTF